MTQSATTVDASRAAESSAHRSPDALAKRVLIIGLDGATWDVLKPMMAAGKMPRLAALLARGSWGVLESTKPPITPAAWTTFMTGKNPGAHGVIDFERYDVRTGELSFNTTLSIDHVRTIWQILGEKGLRVGCVNIPMTYPPPRVNGFVISGFETPSTAAEFTWPPELKADILARWPDYSYRTSWRRKPLGGTKIFAENLALISHSFAQGADITEYCGEKYGWDVLMVVFKLVDNLQHKAWKYLDPRTRERHPKRAAMVADCFAALDVAIGRLAEYAERRDAHVLMMSDHGHGSLEGKVQPNLLLREWGYLALREGGAQAQTRANHLLYRLFRKRKGGRYAQGTFSIEHDLAVDLARTKACVMHAGMYGFLYVNLKGRQPGGIVEAADYEPLRDELRERLLATRCTDPSGKTVPTFWDVLKPELLYGCLRQDREWLPDLMLVPHESLSVVRKIRGRAAVRWLPERRIEGTHRPDGIVAAIGAGVKCSDCVRISIVDCAPTLLAMLGVPVYADMEGRVADELFVHPMQHVTQTARFETSGRSPETAYNSDQLREVTRRLSDLGYLD